MRSATNGVSYQMGTVVSGFCQPVAVFLLAENRLLREALLRILSKKGDLHIAGAVSFGSGVLEQILSTKANVVVLDSLSPVLAEHGLVYKLHHLNPAVGIVMVGMEAEPSVFLRVVQAGALGYVLKDASAADVARTIRAVAAGEAVCPEPCFPSRCFSAWRGTNPRFRAFTSKTNSGSAAGNNN
jgi:DNA-binding NarL/FixJ family response regulator